MKPLYFGASGRPLFGVYHPPGVPGRRTGVVLCHPFGQEYLQAYRSLRELAGRLSDGGFHVLRFDYQGSGDSGGEGREARMDGWISDIAAAMVEVSEAAGSPRVALVGLRLGATLATIAASRRPGGVEALVLWDPVMDGSDYVRQLRATHEAWALEHAPGAEIRTDEVLGFPLPEALAADIAGLALPGTAPARRVLTVCSDDGECRPPLWAHRSAEHRRFKPAPVWTHAEGMGRALVPGELLDFVTAWLGGACP